MMTPSISRRGRGGRLVFFALALLVWSGVAASAAQAQARPGHNRATREAERALGLAMIQTDPEQQKQHFRDALAAALGAVQEDARNATGWLMAGRAYAGLGDFAGADSAFRYAEELHPPYAEELARTARPRGRRRTTWPRMRIRRAGSPRASRSSSRRTGCRASGRTRWWCSAGCTVCRGTTRRR